MVRIIKKETTIHRWDLIDEAKVGIGEYNKVKSYMEWKFDGTIRYDKETELWTFLKPQEALKLPEQEVLDHKK